MVVEDLLERDLAVELRVERDEDRPQAAAGMRPEDAEPLAVAGGRADGVAGRAVGVAVAVLGRAVDGGDVAQRGIDVRVAEIRQALPRGLAGRDGRQALLDVAAVGLEMDIDEGLDQGPLGRGQLPALLEVVGQTPGFIQRPGLEGEHELGLVDDAVLERQQSEQELSIRGDGCHEAGLPGSQVKAILL